MFTTTSLQSVHSSSSTNSRPFNASESLPPTPRRFARAHPSSYILVVAHKVTVIECIGVPASHFLDHFSITITFHAVLSSPTTKSLSMNRHLFDCEYPSPHPVLVNIVRPDAQQDAGAIRQFHHIPTANTLHPMESPSITKWRSISALESRSTRPPHFYRHRPPSDVLVVDHETAVTRCSGFVVVDSCSFRRSSHSIRCPRRPS